MLVQCFDHDVLHSVTTYNTRVPVEGLPCLSYHAAFSAGSLSEEKEDSPTTLSAPPMETGGPVLT